ncbi:hypothetical protein DEU56DRAFT_905566 [Suillus clintonianus]|uniref:uncharacterized protein n=1 Tax=Suillus clintonianus TaxID=1904413 RepID=UPI001B88355D|nr:uncharacterized protein DEU56DRAFT_905566 [Suillus clintonianus]KAG2111020.1 hypothetical protein DEU56DRAFT_905566 [Suillus clintonianus]
MELLLRPGTFTAWCVYCAQQPNPIFSESKRLQDFLGFNSALQTNNKPWSSDSLLPVMHSQFNPKDCTAVISISTLETKTLNEDPDEGRVVLQGQVRKASDKDLQQHK